MIIIYNTVLHEHVLRVQPKSHIAKTRSGIYFFSSANLTFEVRYMDNNMKSNVLINGLKYTIRKQNKKE